MWLVMPGLTKPTMGLMTHFPKSSPDFCRHQQLSGRESQSSSKKDKTVVRYRASIRCELEAFFVTPFSNIFVQLNPWKALIQIKINSWTSVKLFNLRKRFSRYEKTLRELKQIVALQALVRILTFFSYFPIKRLILINIPTMKITGSCLQNNSKRQKYH